MTFTPFRHEKGNLIQTAESVRLQAWLFAVPVTVDEVGEPRAHNFLFFFFLKLEQEREVEKMPQSKFPSSVALKLNLENIEAVWQTSFFWAFSSCLATCQTQKLKTRRSK